MPYVTMGYPQRKSALSLVPALAEGGADLIELGVPFSDPLADGATIQASSQQALENGMTLALCLEQVAELRADGVTLPLVLMGYYNPILQLGPESFAQRATAAGVDGIIVPDLPPEESGELCDFLVNAAIDFVPLLAPTSDDARMRLAARRARGFLYLVSLTGVTGMRDRLASGLEDFVARVRSTTDLPLAVGFGIGTPAQAKRVARVADGVIVGSALVKAIGDSGAPYEAARNFAAALRAGIDSADGAA
jgi:tryptophan synthase alpha chain